MSLKDQSIEVLKFKASILRRIIDTNSDDPRVGEPIRQLNIIEDELLTRRSIDKEQDKDSDNLVVKLKTLELKSSTDLER